MNLSPSLTQNQKTLRIVLTSSDIIFLTVPTPVGNCLLVYVDGVVDKKSLGQGVLAPLKKVTAPLSLQTVQEALTLPERKEIYTIEEVKQEILDGNALLFLEECGVAIALGVKSVPGRAVSEPPTDVTVKGPRAGFSEEIKTNMSMLRTRIKNQRLQFVPLSVGRLTATKVVVCYLSGIAKRSVVQGVLSKLKKIEIDGVIDSSTLTPFLCDRPHSPFRQIGTCEKPDILCAKLLEGRVGIFVDGTPIVLTLPYILSEDFQTADDYYVSPYRATFTRLIRLFSLLLSIYLPGVYVAAQLFKLHLLPVGLVLTVTGSIQGISLSPSLEMLFAVLVLEVLTEASIRMPKYVGLALSVVGALVLGDTAVNAGFLSTPTILIVALSGVCLYTVPDLIECTSLLRLVMLIAAGSIGTFGVVLVTAGVLYYLISVENYQTPLLAPFAPVIQKDLRDSLFKSNLLTLTTRPKVLRPNNKVRLRHE